ncbi:MAG: M56 family metallopeptidase [Streptosporangiaceae bacterium]
MTAALAWFGYAAAVAWFAPPVLVRLTRAGVGARLGLLAWLVAIATAVAAAILAVQALASSAAAGWSALAEVICQSVAGHACAPAVYQSALVDTGLSAAAVAAGLALVLVAARCARGVRRGRDGSRAHAAAARLVGRRLPGEAGGAGAGGAGEIRVTGKIGAVVLDSPRPAAYCVVGRPATIVLTSGTIALLGPGQLRAVLAHERAHLAGRHNTLILLTRALAQAVPGVPLFRGGAERVAVLAEMCADDRAARVSGRPALVTALLAMATGAAVPEAALGTAASAVAARVDRLLTVQRRITMVRYQLALAAVIAALVAVPGWLALLTG